MAECVWARKRSGPVVSGEFARAGMKIARLSGRMARGSTARVLPWGRGDVFVQVRELGQGRHALPGLFDLGSPAPGTGNFEPSSAASADEPVGGGRGLGELGGVDREVVGRESAQAGVLAGAHAVTTRACTRSRSSDLPKPAGAP